MGCVKTVCSHQQHCKIEKSKSEEQNRSWKQTRKMEGEKDETVNEKYMQMHMFEDR